MRLEEKLSKWETEFSEAVAVLKAAFEADREAYDDLIEDTKTVWALWPVRNWPEMHKTGRMATMRNLLIQAENVVRDLVQRRSVALRGARNRRLSMYEHRAFSDTVPGKLAPEMGPLRIQPRRSSGSGAGVIAVSRARNPSVD